MSNVNYFATQQYQMKKKKRQQQNLLVIFPMCVHTQIPPIISLFLTTYVALTEWHAKLASKIYEVT